MLNIHNPARPTSSLCEEMAFQSARVRLTKLGVYHHFSESEWRMNLLAVGAVVLVHDCADGPRFCLLEPQCPISDAFHFMGLFPIT